MECAIEELDVLQQSSSSRIASKTGQRREMNRKQRFQIWASVVMNDENVLQCCCFILLEKGKKFCLLKIISRYFH